MSIEHLVKDAVDDLVQAVPQRPGLADIALRKAARRRHATRIAVAGGTAIVVAAAIPVSAGLINAPGPRPTTGEQTQATRTRGPQLVARTVTVDIDKLRQGSPPSVPWSKNGDAYVGDTKLADRNEAHAAATVHKVEGGYAILAYGENEKLYLLKDGKPTTLSDRSQGRVGTVAVSPDGRRIAWTTTKGSGEGPNTLHLAKVRTGEVILEKPTSGVRIAGFASSGVLLMLPGDGGGYGSIGVWNIQGNQVGGWGLPDETRQVADVAPSGELAILVGESCSEVVETSTGKSLWEGCPPLGTAPLAFSLDNTYVLGQRGADYVVADPYTGKVGLTVRMNANLLHNAVWESDRSFVVTVWKDDHRMALVRCTVTGQCELASPVTTFEPGRGMVAHEGYLPYATLPG